MLNRRAVLATTVGGLGACLFSYVGRCFVWYWDNVIVPEPIREHEIMIHQGNVGHVNPNYYVTMVVTSKGIWMRVNGELVPYNEWLERDVYTRARAPMTKGAYRIGT